MKLLPALSILTLLFSFSSHAGLNPGALEGHTESCGLRSSGTVKPIEIAWYGHRRHGENGDSNMKPLLRYNKNPVDQKRARASFSVGTGQGVQVCPGVFLTARHNVFSSVTGGFKRSGLLFNLMKEQLMEKGLREFI